MQAFKGWSLSCFKGWVYCTESGERFLRATLMHVQWNIVAEVDGRWVHKGSVEKSFLHCITIGVNNTLCASYIKRTTVLWHPWMTLWSFTKLLKANCKALPVRQYWSIAFFRQMAYTAHYIWSAKQDPIFLKFAYFDLDLRRGRSGIGRCRRRRVYGGPQHKPGLKAFWGYL